MCEDGWRGLCTPVEGARLAETSSAGSGLPYFKFEFEFFELGKSAGKEDV